MILDDDKIIKIYNEEYLKGISGLKLGQKYNVNDKYFYRRFKKLGLKVRSNKENSRKYHFDENYFEEINTEDKAYWLGFIYADGYVKTKDNILGIALSIKDKKHLEKFNNCLDSNYPIHEYKTSGGYKKGNGYCRLEVKSDKIKQDLIKHGVVPNKTNILEPPNIKRDLIKHFIRGYLDGDGCIWVGNKNNPKLLERYNIEFLGTDSVLNYINNYLVEEGLLKRMYPHIKRKKEQLVSTIKFGGNQISYKVLSHLYEDCNMYLDRKHELYLELKKLINSRSL